MPELTQTQNYVARIKADLYWIEILINMRSGEESKRVLINKLANIGYLADQAISDLTEEQLFNKEKTLHEI